MAIFITKAGTTNSIIYITKAPPFNLNSRNQYQQAFRYKEVSSVAEVDILIAADKSGFGSLRRRL